MKYERDWHTRIAAGNHGLVAYGLGAGACPCACWAARSIQAGNCSISVRMTSPVDSIHTLSLGFNPGVVFARTTVGRAIRDDASAPGRLPSRGWFWHVHQRWGGAQTRQNPAPPAWARTAGGPQGWKPCGRASREQTGGPPAGAGVRVVPRMTAA